jgi:nitrate/nitrite transport system substrate-binding protein
MAHPMGFYSKHGLNVDVIKTAGWAVVRDKTSTRNTTPRTCWRRCRSRSRWRGLESDPLYDAGGREHQRPGDHARHEAQGQARSEVLEGLQVRGALRLLDAQLPAALLLAEHGIDPDKDVQIRAVPPPEMVANLRADNLDGFLAPDPVNQRAVYDGVGFIHILSKDIWDGIPAAPSRRRRNSSRKCRTPMRRS